ncbi:hypothetical protein C7S15_2485 [Burkholderia cepacia]|nr:hypothetical protein [Burkholderia cepacia]
MVLSGFCNVPLFIVLANKQAISTVIYNAHMTCLISSGHFNLGERPRLIRLGFPDQV